MNNLHSQIFLNIQVEGEEIETVKTNISDRIFNPKFENPQIYSEYRFSKYPMDFQKIKNYLQSVA